MKMYLVGGAVRDKLLGLTSKDWDFSVEVESFEVMRKNLNDLGFTIFLESPEYLTIRAKAPKGFTFAGESIGGLTADFVMCRKDGTYSDGRRPDSVEPGDIYDDLARRDFTVNAIAMDSGGNFIDPFDGRYDLEAKVLGCVGNANDRFAEDALRILRALRFSITKGFDLDDTLQKAITRNSWRLVFVSAERQREELYKMFRYNTLQSIILLNRHSDVRDIVLKDDIWLKPTMEK